MDHSGPSLQLVLLKAFTLYKLESLNLSLSSSSSIATILVAGNAMEDRCKVLSNGMRQTKLKLRLTMDTLLPLEYATLMNPKV